MHVAAAEIRATAASTKGFNYTSATGHAIKNMGEGDVHARSDEGIPIDMTTQVGDSLTNLLISVGRTGEAGNMTIFNCDLKAIRQIARQQSIEENFMYNKKSGISSKIIKREDYTDSQCGSADRKRYNKYPQLGKKKISNAKCADRTGVTFFKGQRT